MKKLLLLSPLALSGCVSWHGTVDADAMSPYYMVFDKKTACVCVKPIVMENLKVSSMIRDYYLDHSPIADALDNELKKFFEDVRPLTDTKKCDYVVTPSCNFTLNTLPESITANLSVHFANQIVPEKSFNVFVNLPNRLYYTDKVATSARIQRLVEMGFNDIFTRFDQELNKSLDRYFVARPKLTTTNPALIKQFNEPTAIVQNVSLNVSMLTDATFDILSKDILIRSFDQKRMADGPTKLREWNLNKLKLKSESGQTWLLMFKVMGIELVANNPDQARLALANPYVPKYPYYMNVAIPTKEDKALLSNAKVGMELPIAFTAGDMNSGVLVLGWSIGEGRALKPYAIRYLSGQDEPTNSQELHKWNVAKRTLAASIVAERKSGVNRCVVDDSIDPNTQAEFIRTCLKSMDKEIYLPTEKEINKELAVLDKKMKRIKRLNK